MEKAITRFAASASVFRGSKAASAPQGAARLFIAHLREKGVLPVERRPSLEDTWPTLAAFRRWMGEQRGIKDSTLDTYQEVLVDLLAARVQMMFDNLPSSSPHIQRGELRALGVTGAKRSALLPDVPTIAESGLPGFEATTWFGLFAPAGTPPAVIEKINAAVNQAMAKPAIIERLRQLGTDAATGTPASFAELVAKDTAKWAKVIKDANIVMN